MHEFICFDVENPQFKMRIGGMVFSADMHNRVATLKSISEGVHKIPAMITIVQGPADPELEELAKLIMESPSTEPAKSSRSATTDSSFMSDARFMRITGYYVEHPVESEESIPFKVYIPNSMICKIIDGSDQYKKFIMPIADTVMLGDESYRSVLNGICEKEILPNSGFTCNDISNDCWIQGHGYRDDISVTLKEVRSNLIKYLYDQYGLPSLIDWANEQTYLSAFVIKRMLNQIGIVVKRSEIYPTPAADVNPEWIRATQAIQVCDRIFHMMSYPFMKYSGEVIAGRDAYDAKFCSMVENITGKHVDDTIQAEIEFKSWLGVDVLQYKNGMLNTVVNIFNAAVDHIKGLTSEDEFVQIQAEQAERLPSQFDKDVILDSIWKHANRRPRYLDSTYSWVCMKIMHDVLWSFAQNN
jgi:hypothetical protein